MHCGHTISTLVDTKCIYKNQLSTAVYIFMIHAIERGYNYNILNFQQLIY